jgi:hypothetical protein
MDEKIEVNDKTIIDLAKIIHKHNQYIQADWEEYTKSDIDLACAIKWNGYRKESDTAREILQELYDQIDENTPKWVEAQIKIIAKRKGLEVE